jgi:hypothetical protein
MIIRVGVKNWYLSVKKHNRRGKFFEEYGVKVVSHCYVDSI